MSPSGLMQEFEIDRAGWSGRGANEIDPGFRIAMDINNCLAVAVA